MLNILLFQYTESNYLFSCFVSTTTSSQGNMFHNKYQWQNINNVKSTSTFNLSLHLCIYHQNTFLPILLGLAINKYTIIQQIFREIWGEICLEANLHLLSSFSFFLLKVLLYNWKRITPQQMCKYINKKIQGT